MPAREICFKNLLATDIPLGMIGYTYKDSDGVIQIGKNVLVEMKTNKKISSKYISKMKKTEKSEGFMFWNTSLKG